MDDMSRKVHYWWMVCARGCTWERTIVGPTADPRWFEESCPTCAAKRAGQVILDPKVA